MKAQTMKFEPMEEPNPITGKIYYDETTNKFKYYNGTIWVSMGVSVYDNWVDNLIESSSDIDTLWSTDGMVNHITDASVTEFFVAGGACYDDIYDASNWSGTGSLVVTKNNYRANVRNTQTGVGTVTQNWDLDLKDYSTDNIFYLKIALVNCNHAGSSSARTPGFWVRDETGNKVGATYNPSVVITNAVITMNKTTGAVTLSYDSIVGGGVTGSATFELGERWYMSLEDYDSDGSDTVFTDMCGAYVEGAGNTSRTGILLFEPQTLDTSAVKTTVAAYDSTGFTASDYDSLTYELNLQDSTSEADFFEVIPGALTTMTSGVDAKLKITVETNGGKKVDFKKYLIGAENEY